MGRLIEAKLREAKLTGDIVYNVLKALKKPRTAHELRSKPHNFGINVGRVQLDNALDILQDTRLVHATETQYRGVAKKKRTYQVTDLGKQVLQRTQEALRRTFSDVLEKCLLREQKTGLRLVITHVEDKGRWVPRDKFIESVENHVSQINDTIDALSVRIERLEEKAEERKALLGSPRKHGSSPCKLSRKSLNRARV